MSLGVGVHIGLNQHGIKRAVATLVPTTWNPLDKSAFVTLSNGNLSMASDGTNWGSVRGTQSRTGDRYFEAVSAGQGGPGFANASASVSTPGYIGADTNGVLFTQDGSVYYNNASITNLGSHALGDVIGCLISSGFVWFLKNGVALNGAPNARTGGLPVPGIGSVIFPAASMISNNVTTTGRFLPASFTQPIPTGAAAWDS